MVKKIREMFIEKKIHAVNVGKQPFKVIYIYGILNFISPPQEVLQFCDFVKKKRIACKSDLFLLVLDSYRVASVTTAYISQPSAVYCVQAPRNP